MAGLGWGVVCVKSHESDFECALPKFDPLDRCKSSVSAVKRENFYRTRTGRTQRQTCEGFAHSQENCKGNQRTCFECQIVCKFGFLGRASMALVVSRITDLPSETICDPSHPCVSFVWQLFSRSLSCLSGWCEIIVQIVLSEVSTLGPEFTFMDCEAGMVK